MEATLNKWRGSPRKFNVLLRATRGGKALETATKLKFVVNPAAEALRKLILSAVSNASQNSKVDINDLCIAEATVGRSFFLKRVHFKGRGKMGRVTKPFCNVRVVLKEARELKERSNGQ